jgi:hypothetical protein
VEEGEATRRTNGDAQPKAPGEWFEGAALCLIARHHVILPCTLPFIIIHQKLGY